MEEKTKTMVYGLSREDEEKQLADILMIAQVNLEKAEKYDSELTEELKDMLEAYETKDKEALTLWHNTESRYQENKRDILRCLKARKKPYFGRIDFKDAKREWEEAYYVGRCGITGKNQEPVVIDWRAPLASVYYENSMGECTYEVKKSGIHKVNLLRKRTYEIAEDKLVDFFDSDVVANDELLTKYLAKSKRAVLSEIIGTIQKEQNAIIRKSPKTNLIVQGVAGSGKTTVAMHRISYILYNYEEFRPEDFYIIGSNRILLNYITGVLPELDVYGVSQMTMEQLFIRLLYEEWDPAVHRVGVLDRKDASVCRKGSYEWFHELEKFCCEFEKKVIPGENVIIEKTGVVLFTAEKIASYLADTPLLSTQTKINTLNEQLLSKLENELTGKSVTYTPEEKKELYYKCRFHFGKNEWKESVFSLYEQFLTFERGKGSSIQPLKENTCDVYDLAALAYLYKRVRETDGIREATHIIIDEAQDFGMMAYASLMYCLRGCTYTIMGDVSQNISFGYGLNDWEELRSLVLTGTYDSFGLLRKSYRNTVEISNFATEILRHGDFAIYPAEPILRHGSEVMAAGLDGEEGLLLKTVETVQGWQQAGHETIGIICRNEEEAAALREKLADKLTLTDSDPETAVFDRGVMVLPVEYTKGLEFDAVLLYNPSNEKYPEDNAHVKLLYVAATRALHELAVLHLGSLSGLIAKPVSREKRLSCFEYEQEAEKPQPKRVIIEMTEEKKQFELEQYARRTQKKYPSASKSAKQKNEASSQGIPERKTEERAVSGRAVLTEEIPQRLMPGSAAPAGAAKRNCPEGDKGRVNSSPYEFNGIPDNSKLTPRGHSRIDNAVRWAKKSKNYVEFSSCYGVLRLTPAAEQVIRVQFHRGQIEEFDSGCFAYESAETAAWTLRENSVMYEMATSQLALRIEKKTGAIQFLDKKGNLLLKEESRVPRQLEPKTAALPAEAWNYFEWGKTEKLTAKGLLDDCLERISGKARYISFGQKRLRMPLLFSDRGYALGIAARGTVMYCGIPMYGQYIYTDAEQLEYYFIFAGDRQKNTGLYKKITLRQEQDF